MYKRMTLHCLHFSAVDPFLDLVVFFFGDIVCFLFFIALTLLALTILDAVVSGMCLAGGRLELI